MGSCNSGGKGGGFVNPVLGKRGRSKTPEQALNDANPNYNNGKQYRVNCQRCIYAYELLRRGYNVEAQPATMNGNDPMFQNHRWMIGFEGQTWSKFDELGNRSAIVEKNIVSKMQGWGEGSRAVAYVEWKSGSAHVFNIENRGGKVSIFEAQSGKERSLSEYLSIAKPSKTLISRVDNLNINEGVMQYAVKKKG